MRNCFIESKTGRLGIYGRDTRSGNRQEVLVGGVGGGGGGEGCKWRVDYSPDVFFSLDHKSYTRGVCAYAFISLSRSV